MKPQNVASAALLVAVFAWPVGCLQLTGVQDYTVEVVPEQPVQCKLDPGAVCRVSTGCWCADGETCYLVDATGAGTCAPAGSVAQGGACTTQGDCAARLLCVYNVCQPVCAKNEECPSKTCQPVAISTIEVIGVGYCVP